MINFNQKGAPNFTSMKKAIILFSLLFLLFAAFCYAAEQKKEKSIDFITIKLNPLMELSYKSKSEIYDIRKIYVKQYPELVKKDYAPSDAVFGQVQDNKPWWGILGLSYFGPGKYSIAGPAEESRFLANPFLFVGLDWIYAITVNDKNLYPKPLYPEPISLIWKKDGSYARVTYDIINYWSRLKQYYNSPGEERKFTLVAYNARDFGFNYLYVVPEKSQNIITSSSEVAPALIRQYIHCGGSCGFTGGCNNMSPNQQELVITISSIPAVAYIKLWRDNPENCDKKADMIFVIKMK